MKRTFKTVIKQAFLKFFTDIKSAKWVIIFIIAYFAFMRIIFHSTCPVVLLSGFPCPACGLSRAGRLLLHLDVTGACKVHPFIFPIAGIILLFLWNRYICLKKTTEWIKWSMIIVIISAVIYYIWRMYHYFPGEPPMSYYSNNLLFYINQLVHGGTG